MDNRFLFIFHFVSHIKDEFRIPFEFLVQFNGSLDCHLDHVEHVPCLKESDREIVHTNRWSRQEPAGVVAGVGGVLRL